MTDQTIDLTIQAFGSAVARPFADYGLGGGRHFYFRRQVQIIEVSPL